MSSVWQIIIPAAGTNLVINPSCEASSSSYSATSGAATVARDTSTAKFAGACLSIVTTGAGASEGAISAYCDTVPSTAYVASVWLRGSAGGEQVTLTLRESTSGLATVGDTVSAAQTLTTTWTRYEVTRTFGATGAKGRVLVRTSGTHAYTLYADAFQLEAGTVATTYIDGTRGGCSWTGVPYASTSVRNAQSRAGGVITNLDSLGTGMTDNGSGSGAGMPPHEHVSSSYGLLDGALFQRTGIKGRSFIVPVWIKGASLADYHAQRKAILNAVKRDLVSPVQPLILRYTGGSEPVEISCHYDGGLEGGARESFTETVPLRFVSDDVYWHGIGNGSTGLVYKNDLTDADYIVERTAQGAWQSLSGGLSGIARCAVYGPDGNLYVGGDFITAYNAAGTGTTSIAKWDGSVWSAVGGNVGVGQVNVMAFGANGVLYIGGFFSNWPNAEANADGDGIVSWDGTSFHRLAGGLASTVADLAIAQNGDVYVGGYFTSAKLAGGGAVASTQYLAMWSASAATPVWTAVGTTVLNNYVGSVVINPAGQLYIGGAFTNSGFPYIARFTGAAWVALGSGINDYVTYLSQDLDGSIIVTGNFTTAGGSALRDKIARWTGSAWLPLDIDLPSTPLSGKVAINPDGRMAIPFTTSGTATASSTVTTVTNRGTGASSPMFRILGPGTIESIYNWTTGKGLFFNYALTAGEYLTVDLRTGRIRCVSTLRGDVLGTAILPSSNLTNFKLLSGANTIVTKMPSGTSVATEVTLMWEELWLSFDT